MAKKGERRPTYRPKAESRSAWWRLIPRWPVFVLGVAMMAPVPFMSSHGSRVAGPLKGWTDILGPQGNQVVGALFFAGLFLVGLSLLLRWLKGGKWF